ncbi:RICIN domain-containing protein [Marinoscillum furvescens]|uniref:Putative secreted protein (Por secretion system target) n=1 Tax=Marinoscillum furvescens DSM 4134 TaxID=1122208 RepID=A0A3D9L0M9_MARFU|nr:RICIN domain-containing protein [Marinoscillum furvescens]RED97016.1 putative secreted protein (Por secretion system target) [Marinoscillum furvescens DSM 4134]
MRTLCKLGRISALFGCLLMAILASAQNSTFRNGPSLSDTNGDLIHAHGVGVIKVGATYYMIGEDRRNIYTFKGVNMYSSQDLVNWTFENTIISDQTHPDLAAKTRFIERPKIIYNASTQEYVVWVHWESGNYGAAEAAVFKSSTITGDYTFVRNMRPNGKMARDCNLFVDDDGTAYFIAAGDENATLYLHELTSDYLNVTGTFWKFFENQNREAPVIFKDGSTYYMLSSGLTGWAPNQGMYATASSVTGPWSAVSNMGNSISFDTQPAHIIPVYGSQTTTWIYVGDRWQDPNLVVSKNIFFPLTVNNGTVQLNNEHEWSVNLTTGVWQSADTRQVLSKSGWSVVSVSSEETTNEPGQATNVLDGNLSTFWHANWSQGSNHPHELILDLGGTHTVNGYSYVPRQDGNVSGLMETFELYLSTDGQNWGDPVAGGWISQQADIGFASTQAAYARLVTHSAFDDSPYVTVAEFDLYTNGGCSNTVELVSTINGVASTPQSGSQTLSVNLGETVAIEVAADFAYGSTIWRGPNGYLDITDEFDGQARGLYFDQFDASDAGRYTLTYLDPQQCASTAVVQINSTGVCGQPYVRPYFQVGAQDWDEGSSLTAFAGQTINFGPQPSSGGTWSWSGCGTGGSLREQSIQPSASCTATATFTNSCGSSSAVTYNITIDQGSGLSGTYRIVNRNSNKALRPGGTATPGSALAQYTVQNTANELWRVQEVATGEFTLQHISSGLFADIDGGSIQPGAANILWNQKTGNNANQRWLLQDQGSGYVHLVNVNSGMFLDISGGSQNDGAPSIQWTDNGGYNQDWQLVNDSSVRKVLSSDEASDISCYPNPTSDFLMVSVPDGVRSFEVRIIDQSGRIRACHSALTQGQLDVRQLPNGLYVLDLSANGIQYRSRFVKR